MKRLPLVITAALLLLVSPFSKAQEQRGIVKTRGRMVNGKLVHGEGIPGTLVSIQGRNTIRVQNKDGSFSFPLNERTFRLVSIKYKNYKPVDADIVGKPFGKSPTPFYIIMEPAEQLLQDQLNQEKKMRLSVERKLHEREYEIDTLKISLKEKNRLLEEVKKERNDYEMIIQNLSKYYASVDYDQIDDFQQKVCVCLENGEYAQADSLLKTKGDLSKRIDKVTKVKDATKRVIEREIEDIAKDCYSFFLLSLSKYEVDSAVHYMTVRAELDTLNSSWQSYAGDCLSTYLNDFKGADVYYQRVLRLARAQDNEESSAVMDAYNLLGTNCIYMNDTIRALQYINKALETGMKIYGPDHPEIAACYNNLGGISYNQKRYAEALEYHKKALKIREKVYDDDHEDVAQSYNNIALASLELGDMEQAEQLFIKSLLIMQKRYGDNHPEVASALYNLGTAYYVMGEPDKATVSLELAMEKWSTAYGEKHPTIGWCLYFLGRICEDSEDPEDYERALDYYLRELDIVRKYEGENSQKAGITYRRIYNTYYKRQDAAKALEFAEKALAVFEGLYGTEHPDVALCYNDMSMVLYMMEEYDKALTHGVKALGIYKRTIIGDHNEKAMCCNNVAAVYYAMHDYDKAIEYCKEALAIRKRLLGEDDPETKLTEKDLQLFESRGK